ncbi:hypothetical protein [Clostridium formicaceticum]|uniref:Uncharacterized protein n=1 Tax=Clostridium formicaceticum TaxID=1497 RepID=A0AAC9RQC5_9CLOT|nr:hypothetical protein [Clostridium formicaceticum]AOY75349.1 hypothetical protein BJL90_05185 [Clostridium formicaceticum]ARE89799.1 hypothetical protein CLFO_42800 [Clostridium formicaceticum]
MLNYIYIALLISFPEALLIFLLGFYLSNVRNINISKLLIMALIQSIIAFLLMLTMISITIRPLIQIVSMYLLVLMFLKFTYYKAIIPVLIGSFLQGGLQSIVFPMISKAFNIELVALRENLQSAILCYIPVFILSIMMLVIITKSRFHVCDIKS